MLSGARPRWSSASGNATTALTISSSAAMPLNVNASDSRFSRRKLRCSRHFMNHVERVDDRLDAGIGAPEREGEAEQKRAAQRGIALGEHPGDLVLHDLERTVRQHQRQRLQVGADGRGIGEQPVERNQRRHRREYREQSEEHDATGGGEHAVVVEALPGAPENIFP